MPWTRWGEVCSVQLFSRHPPSETSSGNTGSVFILRFHHGDWRGPAAAKRRAGLLLDPIWASAPPTQPCPSELPGSLPLSAHLVLPFPVPHLLGASFPKE